MVSNNCRKRRDNSNDDVTMKLNKKNVSNGIETVTNTHPYQRKDYLTNILNVINANERKTSRNFVRNNRNV